MGCFFLAFLLFPIVSECPLWVGPALGGVAVAAQLWGGPRLLAALLRLEPASATSGDAATEHVSATSGDVVAENVAASPADAARENVSPATAACGVSLAGELASALSGRVRLLPQDFPFVMALGGEDELVVSRGFLLACRENPKLATLSRNLLARLRGLTGRILTAALAFPCLLLACETAAEDYGRVRFSHGPLWFLGRFLGAVARFFLAPLRLAFDAESELSPECADLEKRLARVGRLPAWTEALDLLSPVSLARVRRLAKLWLLCGAPDQVDAEMSSYEEDGWVIALPWLGFGVGLLLAVVPPNLWGAPLCCWGLGWAARVWRRFTPDQVRATTLLEAARESGLRGRGVSVRLVGHVIPRPALVLAESGVWLRVQNGAVLLRDCWGLKPSPEVTPEVAGPSEGASGNGAGRVRVTASVLVPNAVGGGNGSACVGNGGASAGRGSACVSNGNDSAIRGGVAEAAVLAASPTTGQRVEVRGWLEPNTLCVIVGIVTRDGRRTRSYPLYRRLSLPLWVAFLGVLWCILQVVGL